jgi:hypothetical protein
MPILRYKLRPCRHHVATEYGESRGAAANLRVPLNPVRDIEMHEVSDELARCWQAAGRHIQTKVQGPLHSWLKVNLNPPFLERLSFRLGNQLFFIRIEDVDERLHVPGSRNGLVYLAQGCQGHPCIMHRARLFGLSKDRARRKAEKLCSCDEGFEKLLSTAE